MSRPVLPALLLVALTAPLAATPLASAAAAPATGASASRAAVARGTVVSGIDVDRSTIPQLQRAMTRDRLSSVALTRYYLRRIERLDGRLGAVVTTNRQALAQARAADRARDRGDRRPLLGIPVLVKDNVNTTGMPTTAGSLALRGSTPTDAFVVKRLKAAGALVLGKTNLSEWANYRGDQSSSGWSAVGGQTHNAYALDRNPCGSSAGSGVAVSADLATVAIGTETDGSIVCPSGQNGIVGVKPTLGLASRTGIVPISPEQDTAGPMTRNVTDAAVVLAALQGVDPADAATADQQGEVPSSYLDALDRSALRGARIGVWREGNFGSSPETDAVMERTISRLRALGATVVDDADVPIDPAYDDENTALQFEFKAAIADYLQRWTAPRYPKTLADLIRFNRAEAERELRWFGQETFEAAQARGPLTDPAYVEARRSARATARAAIDDTLAADDLDAIIAPTNSPAWTTDLVNGDHFLVGSSSPSAISGYPNVTVPAGHAHGLPVGMSLIGPRWGEPELLGLAYAWEQATGVRTPPTLRRTVG
ncbi:amidase [Nocardioides scoriae]|uniref:Amidase n=1 Tax=Nocardioides scoriae TaxID=642780 RepID=A0A1H1LTN4_9ACTN|nr:amidase [Nocardioides scoriae]SDR77702.1 amidase [Nocardioides scoriae]